MVKGSHMTIEQRARCFKSAEHRAKLSAALMGHPVSPEARAKISVAGWKGGPGVFNRKKNAKRRVLGFIPINSPFPSCEGHHLDPDYVLYIPRDLHQKNKHNIWTGRNMQRINTLAVQWWMSQVMRTGHTLLVGG